MSQVCSRRHVVIVSKTTAVIAYWQMQCKDKDWGKGKPLFVNFQVLMVIKIIITTIKV